MSSAMESRQYNETDLAFSQGLSRFGLDDTVLLVERVVHALLQTEKQKFKIIFFLGAAPRSKLTKLGRIMLEYQLQIFTITNTNTQSHTHTHTLTSPAATSLRAHPHVS